MRCPNLFRPVALVVCLVGLFVLSGCGQKGPLYLPQSADQPAAEEEQSAQPGS